MRLEVRLSRFGSNLPTSNVATYKMSQEEIKFGFGMLRGSTVFVDSQSILAVWPTYSLKPLIFAEWRGGQEIQAIIKVGCWTRQVLTN